MQESFGVELEKSFKFNSSHFIVYKGFRESLHGHNYKVSIKMTANKLNDSYYVLDFDIIKEIATKLCSSLKHYILLPKLNPYITIKETEKNTEV